LLGLTFRGIRTAFWPIVDLPDTARFSRGIDSPKGEIMKAVKKLATAFIVVGLMVAGTQTASAAGGTSWICNEHALKVYGSSGGSSASTWTTSTICGNVDVRATYSRNGQPGYVTTWKNGIKSVTVSPGSVTGGSHRALAPQPGYGGIYNT